MNLLNTRSEYGIVSRALHWIIVLAIAVLHIIGAAKHWLVGRVRRRSTAGA